MSQVKQIKIRINQVPPGTAYFAGLIQDVPEHLAEKFIRDGYASPLTPVFTKSFPAREKLIKAGFDTLAELKATDLSTIEGLTKAEITKIEKELAE